MKHFIVRSILFASIISICIATMFYPMHKTLLLTPNYWHTYSHVMNFLFSTQRLQVKKEPTIIIIGGSGCGFGFISSQISEHFNMPIINTGTHAGIGLRLQIEAVRPYIRKGDIVLLIPEYAQFTGTTFWGEGTAVPALYINPKMFSYLTIFQRIHLWKYYPKYFKETIESRKYIEQAKNATTDPYSVYALNEYGDVTLYSYRNHKYNINVDDDFDERTNLFAIHYIQSFIQDCHQQEAIVILLPPARKGQQFYREEQNIMRLTKLLSICQTPYQVVPERYALSDSLFFDTPYHLTYDGCCLRTQMVIHDIDSILNINH